MKKIVPFLPSAVLFLLCIVVDGEPLVRENPISAFTFHFEHANIWHLLANFYVIFCFRPRWDNIPIAYISATLAAMIPFVPMDAPTVGISGMVFAMLARVDALFNNFNWKLLAINFVLAFIPCYNWKIHLFSYIIAFVIWKTYLRINSTRPLR